VTHDMMDSAAWLACSGRNTGNDRGQQTQHNQHREAKTRESRGFATRTRSTTLVPSPCRAPSQGDAAEGGTRCRRTSPLHTSSTWDRVVDTASNPRLSHGDHLLSGTQVSNTYDSETQLTSPSPPAPSYTLHSRALVRLLPGVSPLVDDHVAPLVGTVVAVGALVRLVPRVNSLMYAHLARVGPTVRVSSSTSSLSSDWNAPQRHAEINNLNRTSQLVLAVKEQ
jgi:hypothetical protein